MFVCDFRWLSFSLIFPSSFCCNWIFYKQLSNSLSCPSLIFPFILFSTNLRVQIIDYLPFCLKWVNLLERKCQTCKSVSAVKNYYPLVLFRLSRKFTLFQGCGLYCRLKYRATSISEPYIPFLESFSIPLWYDYTLEREMYIHRGENICSHPSNLFFASTISVIKSHPTIGFVVVTDYDR